MIFGYERVSTEEQNLGRQTEMLLRAGVEQENIFSDKLSGKDMNRPALQRLKGLVRKGDRIVVVSIDRLGRNSKEVVNFVDDMRERGVSIHSLSEGMDTGTEIGKVILTIIAVLAEMERNNIKERQAQGIALAKAEGRMTGRPKCSIDEKEFERVYKKYIDGYISVSEAARLLGVSRATFYRRIECFNERE